MSWGLAVLALAVVGVGLYAWLVEPRRLEVHTVVVDIPGLPPALDGVRIAHLTDLHSRTVFDGQSLALVVDEQNPDLVVVTGDLLDPSDRAEPVLTMLARLADAFPVYYVTGNHEHLFDEADRLSGRAGAPSFASLAGLLDAIREVGVVVLDNRCVELCLERKGIKGTIVLAGVLDPARDHDRLDEALPPRSDKPLLLLAHSPDIMLRQGATRASVVLAGHTHGGQVRLPLIGALITRTRVGRRVAEGLQRISQTRLYVSRGLGTTALPIRFLSPPELPIIELRATDMSRHQCQP